MMRSVIFIYHCLGKKKELVEVEADPDEPQPPLEVDVKVRMHQWASTADSNAELQ